MRPIRPAPPAPATPALVVIVGPQDFEKTAAVRALARSEEATAVQTILNLPPMEGSILRARILADAMYSESTLRAVLLDVDEAPASLYEVADTVMRYDTRGFSLLRGASVPSGRTAA